MVGDRRGVPGLRRPALAGAVSADLQAVAAAALLVSAGAVEGAALGWAQAWVMRRVLVPFTAASVAGNHRARSA
ncbi:hypothetical protein BJF90_35340 [Pseudonocardia sp. CNS-004]|nr:hypothetical protein BJF90_35340 [Pseudonocardia sp. CNS-004]